MAQYEEAKQRYPDALLFFRMGDFYEMFHDDAKVASAALGLTLTARDKARKIPMAGIPVKAADTYLQRLLDQGHKVAVCEQMEDPKQAKGVVDREVVRVLTPGTLTEDSALDPRSANHLAAVRPAAARGRSHVGLAWVELSTGRFRVCECTTQTWLDELARIGPSEVVVPDDEAGQALRTQIEQSLTTTVTLAPDWTFDPDDAKRRLQEHFRLASLEGFGLARRRAARGAAGAALAYLVSTQLTSLGHVTRIETFDPGGALQVERTTRRRLDLLRRVDGSQEGTLVSVLDKTRTAMGGRMLRDWIVSPLADSAGIEWRLDGVQEFVKDSFLRKDIREALGAVRDIERILGRVATGRANARDLLALGRSLETLPALHAMLSGVYSRTLGELRDELRTFDELAALLASAIADDPPAVITDGGMIREGYDERLDELRGLSRDAKTWIANYQASESERTGIPNLKVGYNRVFGYYLEITHAHRDKVPDDYKRKQTLTNAERYVTQALDEYEQKVLRADDEAKVLEQKLFQGLRDAAAKEIEPMQVVAGVLATLDTLATLASVAEAQDYVRPEIVDERVLEIRDGRHPVVEAATGAAGKFVPNDTQLSSAERIGLITGPNMAGKSTYIRQNALIVLMAQMGSFVPASQARIGLCDRLFARVGAEDDLTRGQSTFMVEMSEAAFILGHATERSLVILDEVGRGTSTFDGISIAWALTEYLSEVVGARTLFATHYHELTRLSDELASVRNLHVAVREWGDEIVFLHRIQEGAADRSYGIHVARLAGVPDAVVERARALLAVFEERKRNTTEAVGFGDGTPPAPQDLQLGLFEPEAPDPLREKLSEISIEALTPLEALNLLASLQQEARRPPAHPGSPPR